MEVVPEVIARDAGIDCFLKKCPIVESPRCFDRWNVDFVKQHLALGHVLILYVHSLDQSAGIVLCQECGVTTTPDKIYDLFRFNQK